MSEWRHIRSLGVERPGQAYLHGYDEGPPGRGQVRLEMLYTGFSAGTELTFVKNTNPYLHSRWDGGRGVFSYPARRSSIIRCRSSATWNPRASRNPPCPIMRPAM